MKQNTKRLYSILIAAVLVVAAFLVYFEFIIPAYSSLESAKGQEISEQTLYSNENQIVGDAQKLLTTYQGQSSASQSVTLALPVGQNLAGGLAQVYGIAANAGVTIQATTISIQAVQSPTAPDSSDGALASAATGGSIIKPTGTISFQISGTGSYEAIKTLLQGFENNIRIFDVTSLSLQPQGVAGTKTQAGNADIFGYSMTVVTYYQAS